MEAFQIEGPFSKQVLATSTHEWLRPLASFVRPVRTVAWPEVEAVLPDGGFPVGVVELSSKGGLAAATKMAARAIAAALSASQKAHAAWVDPEETLFGPGLVQQGVDLTRLLVVRPPRREMGHVAIKIAASQAFDVIVLDMDPLAGSSSVFSERAAAGQLKKTRRPMPSEILVRKLALLAGEAGSTVLLLTDALRSRPLPLPVALRLELARTPSMLGIRVAKDRQARIGLAKTWLPMQFGE